MTDMVNISVANAGITAILGYLVVFVGLILLMLVVMLMSCVCDCDSPPRKIKTRTHSIRE